MWTVNTAERKIENEHLSGMSYAGRLVNQYSLDHSGRYPKAFVITNEYGVLAVVFGETNEQDALDVAVDACKLDGHLLKDSDDRYCLHHNDWHLLSEQEEQCEFESVSYLGNASEPFDTEHIGITEMPSNAFLLDSEVIDTIGGNTIDDILYQLRFARFEAKSDEDWDIYKDAHAFLERHQKSNFALVLVIATRERTGEGLSEIVAEKRQGRLTCAGSGFQRY